MIAYYQLKIWQAHADIAMQSPDCVSFEVPHVGTVLCSTD